MNRTFVALLALLVCAPAILHAGGGKPDSEYTSTAAADAVSIRKAPENPDFVAMTFKGLGGYDIEIEADEGSALLLLRWKGKAVDVFSEKDKDAPEGLTNANDRIEWRGLRGADGKFTPYALICRVGRDRATKADPGPTRLVVIELAAEKSKVLGYTHGKNEDADARKIADAARP